MKTIQLLRGTTALLVIWGCTLCHPIRAQNFAIDWFTVDAGGGTSTNGAYAISGTIGQPDAGQLSGSPYVVDGGFWSLVATVQTPGAPWLSLARSGTDVILSWPSTASGFVLEQTSELVPADWTSVNQAPTDDGTTKRVTVPALAGGRFFRLRKL